MHTSSYVNLQKRLALAGREYLEGFSSSDFDGLTIDELTETKTVLIDRAKHGDGVSLDALRQIQRTDEFCDFAERLLQDSLPDLFSAQLATSVCEMRDSAPVWAIVLRLLSHSDTSAKRWLVNKLPSIAIPHSQVNELLQVLAELIQKESDKSMLLGESTLLLLSKGFLPRSPELTEYALRLQSADVRIRRQALMELGCSYVKGDATLLPDRA